MFVLTPDREAVNLEFIERVRAVRIDQGEYEVLGDWYKGGTAVVLGRFDTIEEAQQRVQRIALVANGQPYDQDRNG
jgi:hypothetical protein